jgi:hypothetical protein
VASPSPEKQDSSPSSEPLYFKSGKSATFVTNEQVLTNRQLIEQVISHVKSKFVELPSLIVGHYISIRVKDVID